MRRIALLPRSRLAILVMVGGIAAALGGASALAGVAAGLCAAVTLMRDRSNDEQAPTEAETVPDVEHASPIASLAFLNDPFAIPPPVLADMQAVEPFVETLCGQIEGIQNDVENGVVAVVDKVRAVDRASQSQRDRIRATLAGADTIMRATEVPGEIVSRLATMLAERDQQIEANFAGLQTLADEFQGLRSTVDMITKIADKAFFLSVNAAVEAQHRGGAGSAFALIAAEMRSLAKQTAESAHDVGVDINAFSERMHDQITAAMPSKKAGLETLDSLVDELRQAQDRILESSSDLDRVIQTLDAGHWEIVTTLSDILGNLQFQDVMRQRLEQVFNALRALEDLVARANRGAPPARSLLEVLEDQRNGYVMESQRNVYSTMLAGEEAIQPSDAKIELF